MSAAEIEASGYKGELPDSPDFDGLFHALGKKAGGLTIGHFQREFPEWARINTLKSEYDLLRLIHAVAQGTAKEGDALKIERRRIRMKDALAFARSKDAKIGLVWLDENWVNQ